MNTASLEKKAISCSVDVSLLCLLGLASRWTLSTHTVVPLRTPVGWSVEHTISQTGEREAMIQM